MLDIRELGIGPCKFLEKRRAELAGLRFERIQAAPLSPTIGAELRGVDLANLDDETFAEIERAFLEYKVIFFRDQDISTEQHLSFAQRFGELEEHPFIKAKDGYGEIVSFEKDEKVVGVENIWHSDVSWREVPSLGSVLRARAVPEVGGDTLWSDMEAAYQGLPDDLKERIDGLRAIHDFSQSFGIGLPPEQLAESRKKFPPAEHPVVRTHPRTGRKSIYVNGIFTSHVVGMEPEESDALLRRLFQEARVPEYQCRFHWEPNSMAFWDNRAVQHYATSDYWPQRRIMERVTVIGDRPH